MPEKDKQPVAKKEENAEEGALSLDFIDEKAPAEQEKSSPAPGQNPPDQSDNRQSKGSDSLTKTIRGKAELDLEGLGNKTSSAKAAPRPPMSLKGRRWRLAVAVPVLISLLLGASWFCYEYAKTRKKEKKQEGVPVQSVPPQEVSQPLSMIEFYHFYGLAPFFVPIPMEQIGREGFLKVTLSLAFRANVPSDEISKKILMIRSKITDVLLEKSLSDLHPGGGKIALKQEIKDLLNANLTQGTVQSVYFEEFFIL